MKFHVIAIATLSFVALLANARAVDQFFSNGVTIDGWNDVPVTTDPEGPYFWTIHFFKKNPEDIFYTQNVAKKYKNARSPHLRGVTLLFSDPQRVFTGFYVNDTGEYSILPRHLRRARLEDIRPESFPTPGEMPSLYEMGRKNCEPKREDARRFADPPPTPE